MRELKKARVSHCYVEAYKVVEPIVRTVEYTNLE